MLFKEWLSNLGTSTSLYLIIVLDQLLSVSMQAWSCTLNWHWSLGMFSTAFLVMNKDICTTCVQTWTLSLLLEMCSFLVPPSILDTSNCMNCGPAWLLFLAVPLPASEANVNNKHNFKCCTVRHRCFRHDLHTGCHKHCRCEQYCLHIDLKPNYNFCYERSMKWQWFGLAA